MLQLDPLILSAVIKTVLILITGSAWFLVSGLNRTANVLERLVLSTCLGLATAVLIGLFVVIVHLSFSLAEALMIAFAVVLIVLWLCTKPRLLIEKLHTITYSKYWLPATLFLLHLTLWALYLNTYPYFSNTNPPDVLWHWLTTNSILAGTNTGPISATGYPDGAHILFAFISSYFQVSVPTSMRITAAFVESISVLVAYCLFHRLLKSNMAADYASVAYALIIPAGLVYYARLGAYPNIIGDFFVLTSLLLAALARDNLTFRSAATVILVNSVALISHDSVVIIALLVIVFSPAVLWAYRSQFRTYLLSNLGFFLLPWVAIFGASSLVRRMLNYIIPAYFQIATNLTVYSEVWSHNFLFLPGPLNFILLLAAFLFALIYGRKNIWVMFLVAWFALLNMLVFFATFSERLILLSFVPGAGLMGLLLAEIHESIHRIALPRIHIAKLRKILLSVVMVGLVAILAINGPATFEVSQVLAPGQALMQRHIYDSMVWIGTNTLPNASVASIGLFKEYRYLPLITNRTYVGDFPLNSDQLLQQLTSLGFNYIAVSAFFPGLSTYYNSSVLRPAYLNPDVVIFSVLQ